MCCLGGGIAFALQIVWLINLLINIGMGGAITAVSILLTIWFKKMGA